MNTDMAPMQNAIKIWLNETFVGLIVCLPDDRNVFVFDESYIGDPDRPTLSLSYKAADGLVTEPDMRRTRLSPFFSNLLPEGHLREYLANKLGLNSQREFLLLAALGTDLPGAVRAQAPVEIEHLFDDTREDASGDSDGDGILRFSLAGVQLKFSAILESSGALTIPVHGVGGSWIVKVPNLSVKQVPEAEYAMMVLAQKAGIITPEFKLVPTKSIGNLPLDINVDHGDSFAIRRFDRKADGSRIHMEDFAQVFGLYSAKKYGKASYDLMAEVIYAEAGETSLLEYVRRLVFTIAIGNGDMHVKNWSLLYEDGRTPILSPAYDFIPTIVYMKNDRLGLRLAGEDEFRKITLEHFQKLAARARASERAVLRVAEETAHLVKSMWRDIRHDLPIPDEFVRTITDHMDSLELLGARHLRT